MTVPAVPAVAASEASRRRLLLLVALGGALGALLRHGVDVAVPVAPLGFPWPTLAINTSGSAALALLGTVAVVRRSEAFRAFLGPGLLGGWTTLSTYAEHGRRLLDGDRPLLAAAYLLGTLVACLLGCLAGTAVGERLGGRLGAQGDERTVDR